MKRKAIYPGSFDPITNGHLDVIERAAKLFDTVIVAVANNSAKSPLLDVSERKALVEEATGHVINLEIDTFDGLLVNYVAKRQGHAIVRGLRAVSDFEFEFQLALMNRQLNDTIETIFMMPKDRFTFLSSSIVKEIASLNGSIDAFVPAPVHRALKKKFDSGTQTETN
ncbi:MAG: Phosphopantetheine adenylyltransferase [Verrucomicrobia subdivision 3 bacterium]|nr:Phosphopantetheine adenylyltransferase [Limisphaerales bacterium]MCS1415486.1 Phosphopantetheine adenylyltransferase [Limisphaerales bacterium]